jgi:hypothetical protein
MRRPYHTFRGFDIGTKELSKWIAIPDHGFCPYCSEWGCKLTGGVIYEGEEFTLWECTTEPCRKMHEGKESPKHQKYIRFDAELKRKLEGQS